MLSRNLLKTKALLNFHFDRLLLIPAIMLTIIGLLMVASASLAISSKDFGSPFHFFMHQSVYVLMGLCVALTVSRVQLSFWHRYSPYLLILTIFGLIMVLLPGIGKHINGAKRWIGLGFFHLQVSEIAKLVVILYIGGYLDRRQDEITSSLWGFLKPLLVLSIFAVLLLLEPDFGATAVLIFVALGMMFLAGVSLRQFSILVLLTILMLVVLIVMAPYRLERVLNFLNPWENLYSGGYQLTQALMAFGRGGIFGVGLGNSVQKLFYLPEAHTDFLFAVIGEEMGLIGCITVIFLYFIIIARAFYLGRLALAQQAYFAGYIGYGLALWLAFQSAVNIGVNIGVLPTKGLTLPFISYGGSSLLVSSIAIGILLRIYFELYYLRPVASKYGRQKFS